MSKASSTSVLIALLSISSNILWAQKAEIADSQVVPTELQVRLEKTVVIPLDVSGRY